MRNLFNDLEYGMNDKMVPAETRRRLYAFEFSLQRALERAARGARRDRPSPRVSIHR
jgi:hypothetical protein